LCRRLDARLQGAARKLGFEYSRYADDLLFSSKAEKPFAVAMRDLATRIITDEKLTVNEDKTPSCARVAARL
jgi:hypothetical protein